MPYTISFSDPTKFDTITVPDMPPGINTVDTSLSLVGRGYPNYGQKIAENFVHILENFASPVPPENPIEGQLWYDTSDPNNKVLRIMDGTATATRWPSANGIYQQGTDPKDSATQGLKVGDIWVDTGNNQLKIFNSNEWTLIGPSVSGTEPTGSEPAIIVDTTNVERRVILNKVKGKVVAIVAIEQFTPKAVIDGFTILKPGINLSTSAQLNQPAPIFNGTAVRSQSLVNSLGDTFDTDEFLRKNDSSQYGQIIEGVIKFKTPSTNTTLTGQGRDGIVINNATSITDSNYIQFFKGDNDAVILNNTANGKIVFKVKGTALNTVLELSSNQMNLTGAASVSDTLTVGGAVSISSTASNSLAIAGGASVAKNLLVTGNVSVNGTSSFSGAITASGSIIPATTLSIDLGSDTKKFRNIYAQQIGTVGSVLVGSFNGLAAGLQHSTEFKIRGQITGTSFLFNGSTLTNATFTTTLTTSAISDQTTVTQTTSTLNLLVLDTASDSLGQISRDTFLAEANPPGMITAYGGVAAPSGWLLCDGAQYSTSSYTRLWQVVQYNYGGSSGNFAVPDMRKSTTATNSTTFINYIIKI